jgi:uncharacterized protein involved in tellurium resistance
MDLDRIDDSIVNADFFDEMMNAGEILRRKDIKSYIGIFTGKMVKPLELDLGSIEEFKKGDVVIVQNLEDYGKYHDGIGLIIKWLNRISNDLK